MRRALVLALLLVACTSAAPPVADSPRLFQFQSNFWMNLHHFLRAAGRGMPVDVSMTEEERAVWDRAVAVYRDDYSKRDLLFDEGMVAIKNALRKDEIPAEFRATLESVAPVYRRHFWPGHDAANRAWIANAEQLVRKHGAAIAPRVAAAYETQWPAEPIPVDLTVTAGANGAYTTYPPHVTISSMDRGNGGLASLEIVFHESSHQWGRRLIDGINGSGKNVPRGLWHAVLFYNAGEITRRALAEAGIDYVEYGIAVYPDLCGAGCRDRIAPAWNEHLDGRITVEEALRRIVATF